MLTICVHKAHDVLIHVVSHQSQLGPPDRMSRHVFAKPQRYGLDRVVSRISVVHALTHIAHAKAAANARMRGPMLHARARNAHPAGVRHSGPNVGADNLNVERAGERVAAPRAAVHGRTATLADWSARNDAAMMANANIHYILIANNHASYIPTQRTPELEIAPRAHRCCGLAMHTSARPRQCM